jgi:serine/threonine protein kinase
MEAGVKILVVEDEDSVRRNLAKMLRLEGYDVIEAENGRIGLALAIQDQPDLILSDVLMPESDGHAFLAAVRQTPAIAGIPFVFLTALADRVDRRIGMNLGADDYLNKPFSREDVLDAVQARLKRVQAHKPAAVDIDLPTDLVQLKGYSIVRRLGGGGMSEVYLGRREADGVAVALKLLDTRLGAASHLLDRFIQECEMLESIRHPNVARMYGHGFTDSHAFISMEYFECGDIRQRMNSGMTPFQALSVTYQVALALKQVHVLGIVHRDVKPENLMLRANGSVALIDFGVAKFAKQNMTFTLHGEIVGSPYYMSPEQAAGKPVCPASDIYSLGVIFFEMVTGRRPYSAETMDAMLHLHMQAALPQFDARHAEFQPLLDGMMSKTLSSRFVQAGQVADVILARWPQALRRELHDHPASGPA